VHHLDIIGGLWYKGLAFVHKGASPSIQAHQLHDTLLTMVFFGIPIILEQFAECKAETGDDLY
jgi:hypothetical protein